MVTRTQIDIKNMTSKMLRRKKQVKCYLRLSEIQLIDSYKNHMLNLII